MQEDICKCPCHAGHALHFLHFLPCGCATCPECSEQIYLDRFRKHTQECATIKRVYQVIVTFLEKQGVCPSGLPDLVRRNITLSQTYIVAGKKAAVKAAVAWA